MASTMVHGQQQDHTHHHHHSASASSTSYSYSPSDFDLLRALTSGSAGRTTAKKALKQQQSQSLRRPQLDPLILETAASSGPHVTRNHFLHEFYPHPEDPSSAFSWHASKANGRSSFRSTRPGAYASCDIGPEDVAALNAAPSSSAASAHLQGALEQNEYPTASTSTSVNASTGLPDPNTSKLPRAVEDDTNEADDESVPSHSHSLYRSRQAPRKVRLERERIEQQEISRLQQEELENGDSGSIDKDTSILNAGIHSNLKEVDPSEKLNHSLSTPDSQTSIFHPDPVHLPQILKISQPSFFNPYPSSLSSGPTSLPTSSIPMPSFSKPPLQVVCYARTRVPTPHGEVFLHIYKNNWDDKEHLAFVFDREQLEDTSSRSGTDIDENGKLNREQAYGTLRSKSLDAVWRKGETDVERIVRGAYVGRLSPTSAEVSRPTRSRGSQNQENEEEEGEINNNDDAVLVRIHSECFTGETIGSQRCDCGEQLDEAFRLIGTSSTGLGVIIYLRQEGRGIGLLEKIKAYNLQDLGHDTVTANLLLGHGADQRDYALAGEMLRDLGIGNHDKKLDGKGRNVRLLTNNPDKIDSIEKEGIKVEERVPMVPRGWTVQMPHINLQKKSSNRRNKRKSKKALSSSKNNGETLTKQKTRRPKLNLQDSIMSIRSTALESPMLSPALSASSIPTRKLKNKTIEALKPLSSSLDADGIRSIEVSASEAETEDIDNDDAVDSYEMPSAPGSADERDSLGDHPASTARDGDDNIEELSPEEEEEEEDEEEEEEDSDDSAEREEALEDYLISMNRTGVGMIGAGVTHSKELEKYLKTKIERMGHMLVAPATPPSTPLPLQRGSRIRSTSHQHEKKNNNHQSSNLKHEHREISNSNNNNNHSTSNNMGDSIISLPKTDEESIKCDIGEEECEDCQRQNEEERIRLRRDYFDTEIHSEDMFG